MNKWAEAQINKQEDTLEIIVEGGRWGGSVKQLMVEEGGGFEKKRVKT